MMLPRDTILDQALAQLGAGCVIPAPDGGWTLLGAAAQLLGINTADSTAALTATTLDGDRDRWRTALDAGTGVVEFRVLPNNGDSKEGGSVRFLRATAIAAGFVVEDVSARLGMLPTLMHQMAEANKLEALGTLAGGIAHEINNPVQFISDNLAFLKDATSKLCAFARAVAPLPDAAPLAETLPLEMMEREIPAAIDQALAGTAHIGAVVRAIAEFCYPGAVTPMPCNLNHLIDIATTVTRNKWKSTARLELDLDPTLPVILAVESELYQVLANLIINATHAISARPRPEGGRIAITTRRQRAMVHLTVTDNGSGIAAETLPRIFDMFFTTKPPGQGTGQGLAIAQAIVTRHGGRIWADSTSDHGSMFHVLLPAAGPPPEAR